MGTKRVTFGQLSKALKSLGFEEMIGRRNQHVFRHGETRALIALPKMAKSAIVSPRHLSAVGRTLEHFEIADILEFGALLHPSDVAPPVAMPTDDN
jgi:hypothetical protein